MRIQRFLYLWLLCALVGAFVFVACGETSGSGPVEPPSDEQNDAPPPSDPDDNDDEKEEKSGDDFFIDDLPTDEDLDLSHLTPIPCDATVPDALCYDTNAFVAAYPERIETYRQWQYGLYAEGETLNEEKENALQEVLDKVIESTHEMLGSCNYYRDEQGRTRVKCPDDLQGVFACPHMWFHPEMFVLGGIRYKEGEDPVCYEQLVPEPGGFCNIMGCSDGKVCTGPFSLLLDQSVEEDANELMSALPVCLSPEMCLELRESQDLYYYDSCFFSDRTRLSSTPEIAHADDCDALDDDLCALNCPCADPQAHCIFISQEHPIGMCSTTRCHSNSDCSGQEVCVQDQYYRQFDAARWVLEDLFGHIDAGFDDCVKPSACESWLEIHPGANAPMPVVHCDGND